jgi:hypothetical protein
MSGRCDSVRTSFTRNTVQVLKRLRPVAELCSKLNHEVVCWEPDALAVCFLATYEIQTLKKFDILFAQSQ